MERLIMKIEVPGRVGPDQVRAIVGRDINLDMEGFLGPLIPARTGVLANANIEYTGPAGDAHVRGFATNLGLDPDPAPGIITVLAIGVEYPGPDDVVLS